MDTIKNIFSKAEELFLRYGVKSVSMDDLANALGVSKKTIYQYVANKQDLVIRAIQQHIEDEKEAIGKIQAENDSAIEEIYNIGRHVVNHLKSLNPSLLYDMQKYYPNAWTQIEDYKHAFIYETIMTNIKAGMSQGLYRGDIDPDLMARFYIAGTDMMTSMGQDRQRDVNFTLAEVYSEYLKFYVRGIASDRGLEVLNQLKTT